MNEVLEQAERLEIYRVKARKGKRRERPGTFSNKSRCLAQAIYNAQKQEEKSFLPVSRDHVSCGSPEITEQRTYRQLMSCVGCSAIAIVERDENWNMVSITEPLEDGERNLYFSGYTNNRLDDCPEVTFRIAPVAEAQ